MRRVWIARTALAAACLLAGCETMDMGGFSGFGASKKAESLPPQGQSIPAPRPQGTKLTITQADQGITFQVKQGDRIAINLVGTPTAGYEWMAPKVPQVLTLAGRLSGPTVSDQLYPGYAGGNHWEVLAFDAVKIGAGKLKLEQRRSSESKEKPEATFNVTFEVIK